MTSMTNPAVLRGGAAALAAGRVAFGLMATVRPERVARPWVGKVSGDSSTVEVLGRAMGGRDAALGAGALLALAGPSQRAWPWVAAGGLADAADAAATVLAWRELPRGRWLVAVVAGGAAITSAALCCGLAATRSR